ncbi:MAG: protein kinase, partial [Planctomycetota bacterium]
MSGEHQQDDSSEDRLVAALEEYQRANENGCGESPESFARRYPGLERALLECLSPLTRLVAREGLPDAESGWISSQLQGQQRLGDFQLLREIGRGGMGIVYEAIQLSIGRKVAVKVLPFAAVLDPQQVKRFQNEARAAGTLHHDHIVPVLAVGEERGVYFYAMRLVHGQSLAQLLAGRRDGNVGGEREPGVAIPVFDQAEVSTAKLRHASNSTDAGTLSRSTHHEMARFAAEVAAALHHAHSNGILHRDIKPSNLLIDHEGKAWVTDFGLARLESQSELTRSGSLLGTLRYLPPEALRDSSSYVDHCSDIYALGLTLYESLVLRPAFDEAQHDQLVHQILTKEPPALRQLDPTVPLDLQTIVEKAIAKEPADRYDSAELLAEDLRCFLESKPIRARPAGPIEKLSKWRRRHSQLVNAVLTTAFLFAGLGVLMLWRENGRTKQALVMADEHAQQADRNLDLSLELLDDVALGAIAEQDIYESDVDLERQIRFAEEILAVYEQLHAEVSESPRTQYALAVACRRIARLNIAFGYPPRRDELMQRASHYLSDLCARVPGNLTYQEEYANVLHRRGGFSNAQHAMGILEPLVEKAVITNRGLEHLIHAYDEAIRCSQGNGGIAHAERLFGKLLDTRSQLTRRDPACRTVMEGVGLGHFISCLIQSGRLDTAERIAEQMMDVTSAACERHPSSKRQSFFHGRAMTRMVRVLKAKGQLKEALELSREVVKIQEAVCNHFSNYDLYAQMYCWHGVLHCSLLREMGRTEEQEEYLDGFFDRVPRTRFLLRARGRILEKCGKLERAIEDYEASLALDSDYYYAVFSLAYALKTSGDRARAFELMDRLVKLRPKHLGILFDHARLAREQGEVEKA